MIVLNTQIYVKEKQFRDIKKECVCLSVVVRKVIGTCGSHFGEVVFPAEDHPRFSRPPLQDAPRQSRQPEDEDDVDQGHEERVVEVLVRGRGGTVGNLSGIVTDRGQRERDPHTRS